jgi:hypothetical protein
MSKPTKKMYNFRFDDDLIDSIDAWRELQPVPPSRTDVFRIAVERFLAEVAGQSRRASKAK